jgi:hypothetical protein
MNYKVETNKGIVNLKFQHVDQLNAFLNKHYKSWQILENKPKVKKPKKGFLNAYNIVPKDIETEILRLKENDSLILSINCKRESNIFYYLNKNFDNYKDFSVYKTNTDGEYLVFKKLVYTLDYFLKAAEDLPKAHTCKEAAKLLESHSSIVYHGTSLSAIRKKINCKLNASRLKEGCYLITKSEGEAIANRQLYKLLKD